MVRKKRKAVEEWMDKVRSRPYSNIRSSEFMPVVLADDIEETMDGLHRFMEGR